MKSVEPVNKDRLARMYVERKTVVSHVSTVDRITAIKPVHNNASHVNENFVLFAGIFYDNFSLLKEQYRRFYLHHHELEKFMDERTDDPVSESTEDLSQHMEELTEKYNASLQSLKMLEAHYQALEHSSALKSIFEPYESHLGKIGLTLDEDLSLSFNKSLFQENIEEHRDSLALLFNYKTGLVRKLFNHFRGIKVATSKMLPTYGEDQNTTAKGMILDTQY